MASGTIEREDALTPIVGAPQGVIDRILRLVDRLPGPAAVGWLAIGLALAAVGQLIVWAGGGLPVGAVSHNVVAPTLVFAWFGWLLQTLNRVALSSFDEFRVALGDPGSDDLYRHKLTAINDARALLAAIGAIVVVAVAYYAGVRPTVGTVSFAIEGVSAPLWGLAVATLGVVVLHTVTQLRLVSRLSAKARYVDIFNPAPINSFSRLTAVSAIGLIAFVVGFVLFSPEQPVPYIVQEAALLVVAAASFVLPLRVMHGRLVTEKAALQAASQGRLKQVLARVHDAVDRDDLTRADQLHEMLKSVLAERDELARLHTWPWSGGTFRGFTTALLLPIVIFLITRAIEQLL